MQRSHPTHTQLWHGWSWRLVRAVVLMLISGAWVSPVWLLPSEAEASPFGVNPVPTLFVTTTAVSQSGNAADGQCDLWEALQAIVNANLGNAPTYHECTAAQGLPNVIGFSGAAAGGTIVVGGNVDLPFVWGDTTILGPITIDGGGPAGDHHLFRLAGGATFTLIGATVKNSHTSGAGAFVLDTNGGTVNIIGSSITGHTADNDGGAIDSRGDLNIVLSNFSGNQALGLANGTGYGGAINMHGSGRLTIAQTNFAGNIATGGGGAVYVSNQTTQVSDSAFNGNIASPITQTATTGGGAFYVATNASVQVERTAFTANLSPSGHGGAMYAGINATIFVTDTSFNGNLAGGLTNAQLGGGIYNMAQLQVVRSAFLNNNAVQGSGGGLAVDRGSKATVANTLFAFNTAPLGVGGGILITNTQTGGPASTFIAKNVTISQNAAKPPSGNGGGIHNTAGHSAQLGNTILDGNLSGNCVGPITSLGHNLDSGTGCGLTNGVNGDITNGNANLDSPKPNGGPISSLLSQKLLAGSAAIDAGDNAICAASPVNNEDQNGGSRPKDGDGNVSAICDIGAFEDDTLKAGYGSTPAQPGPITFGNATVGALITTTLTILSTGDATLIVSAPSLGGVNASDFGVSTTFPINILSPGSTKDVVLRCTPSAAGTRTATLTVATNDAAHPLVLYDLSCDGTAAPKAGYDSVPDAPGPLTFPKTVVGQSSAIKLKVMEAGNITLNVTNTVVSGPHAGDFSVSGGSFTIANGGAPQNITIQCTPSDVNLRTATLTVNNNDPNRSNVQYALTCPAIPPTNYLVPGTSILSATTSFLDGPYGVAVSPDGDNVFAIATNSGRILSFARASDGNLTFQNSVDPFGVLAGGRMAAVSPNGKQVYAMGYNNREIVIFDRNPTDGSAVLKIPGGGVVDVSLGGAFGVAISPDGTSVYATGYVSNALVVFSRNTATGILSRTQTIISATHLAGATGVTVSPDGQNVYVTGYTSTVTGQLAVFKRNVLNGQLTYQQTKINFGGGFCFIDCVDGLNGAYQVVVSPDGLHVYTVGAYDNAVSVFDRDPIDGKLIFNAVYKNGVGGITGLGFANAIVIAPDGEHLFVSSFNDKAVAVFLRDPLSGQLSELQVIQRNPFNGAGGNPPLAGARDLDISPDGQAVYVAGSLDDALAVLLVANPTPILNNLAPASFVAGSSAFSLTVNGENFVSGAQVYWNGSQRTTTFVNSTQLVATISASDIASSGGYPVRVLNPAPGASFSNILTFAVQSSPILNPVPSVNFINPQGAVAGSGAVILTLNGTGFIGASIVRWNGDNLPTTYIDGTQLQAVVAATRTVNAGIASVTVFNPALGGGTSNAVAFTIATPLQNPPPSITQLSPVWVFSYGAGSAPVTLIITGTNFVNGAKVQWNGVDLPTTFVSSTMLKATVTSANMALPNTATITAENPVPGGGVSNPLSFEVRKLYRNLLPLLIR